MKNAPPIPIVALTGFMGSGKTSIGRALAALLHWNFVDLDQQIELSEGMPVREIFRLRGEAEFRTTETEALRRILAEPSVPMVLALGGGTFVQAVNADILREARARVIFLEPTLEEMLARCGLATQTSAEGLRPLAADAEGFRALYAQRLPQYRKAHVTINTTGDSVEDNARKIAGQLAIHPAS
jgi:shikimate kinase